MNWKAFGKGVLAAAAGGAFTGTTAVLQDGTISSKQVASSALAGAILGVAAYLKQSPLPAKTKPKPQQADPPPDPGPQG
jgi:hypothetical protein